MKERVVSGGVCLTREQMLHLVLHTLSTMNAFNPPDTLPQYLLSTIVKQKCPARICTTTQ
jgi:hypothetical protein